MLGFTALMIKGELKSKEIVCSFKSSFDFHPLSFRHLHVGGDNTIFIMDSSPNFNFSVS